MIGGNVQSPAVLRNPVGAQLIGYGDRNVSDYLRGKPVDIAQVMGASSIVHDGSMWRITAPTVIENRNGLVIDGHGAVLFDEGIEDDDSGMTGRLRRFLGLVFASCEDITFQNFILRADTNKLGNGVIRNDLGYSNMLRFFQCTTVRFKKILLDFRTDKPDSAFRSEETFVDDLMRSFPVYFDQSNNIVMEEVGIARTNDTGEVIGAHQADGVTVKNMFTMKGTNEPSNHSSLIKLIKINNGDISRTRAHTSYGGSLIDVSGKNIKIHGFDSDMPNGGIVDATREWGPAGGDIENITFENLSTTGRNLISTAAATSVLEANTGKTYLTSANRIKGVRVINCSAANDAHPFSDKRQPVSHAINSKDVQDFYLEGYGKSIRNPEDLTCEPTTDDMSISYDHTCKGYRFYQDETPQNYNARILACGKHKYIDTEFDFSPNVANPNKSLLVIEDLQLTNAEPGIDKDNTKTSVEFVDTEFTHVTFIIKANTKFKRCKFKNCIFIDAGVDVYFEIDSECEFIVSDAANSLVGTDANNRAVLIFFETIREPKFRAKVSGVYVRPSGSFGVIGTIASSGILQEYDKARFNIEARVSEGGAAVNDNCIFHWSRNDNETVLNNVRNRNSNMTLCRAYVGGSSTSSRLDIGHCVTRGELVNAGGSFTNATLRVTNNTCTQVGAIGSWTQLTNESNVVGAS